MQMFPPIQVQPQQQSPPMAPPGPPPPMPPATYEEDPAAQAARGYVYAYPPYAYPGQVRSFLVRFVRTDEGAQWLRCRWFSP